MSYRHIREKRVIIRKDRRCSTCNRQYSKGNKMFNAVGVFREDFQSLHLCRTCKIHLWDDASECCVDYWGEGEFADCSDIRNCESWQAADKVVTKNEN